jgi:DMSO/TMAO reductase YedYZ molybdopterin-dependent catalytic subunit
MTDRVRPRPSILAAALIGVLAVAAALTVAHFVAGLIEPASSPFFAVGNTAIDHTPEFAKEFAIKHFGSNDKNVLLLGMAVVMLVVGLITGLLARIKALFGIIVVVVLGVVGLLAVQGRPDTSAVGAFSAVVAAVVGVTVLLLLLRAAPKRAPHSRRRNPESAEPQGDAAEGMSRRGFLGTSAAVAAGAGIAGYGGQLVLASADPSKVGTIAAAKPLAPLPSGIDFVADGGLPFTTPNDVFYRVDTSLQPPQINVNDWQLKIHGMVNKEMTLSFQDLIKRPLIEERITMTCVSNEVGGDLVSSADWVGVSLRDLLMEAGVQPGADQILSTASGGYSAGTPLNVVLEPDRGALLAVNMNGEPLPVIHGFPVRMIVPGIYGFASATKWITDIELTTFAAKQAYWIPRGYAAKAPIKTESKITVPGGFQQVKAGRVTATGTAWMQGVGIKSVEVMLDSGPWQQARLATEVNKDTWRMWRIDLENVPAGSHTLACRATDANGTLQTQERASTLPDGAAGWHSVLFTAS